VWQTIINGGASTGLYARTMAQLDAAQELIGFR
jgi:hypothetical protein